MFKGASGALVSALTELVDKHALDVFEIEEAFGWSYAIAQKKLLPIVVRLHGTWHLNRRLLDPNNSLPETASASSERAKDFDRCN